MAAALASVLTGCGAYEQAPNDAATPTATPTATGAAYGPRGTADPDALRDFECQPDTSGAWSATGTLTNTSGGLSDYVVTVAVVPGQNGATAAKRERVIGLGAGHSVPIEMYRLPVPTAVGDLTCQVQVLRR